ncbi:hypothetical protein L2744_08435 [Shewanella profunda]|uniref:hypothetical protein n=1 Tax=Shewanella profunda TaxID=254793 RepID=UPI00200EB4A0|nr:hypothetical protein [Shewanella profunda]MCL1089633.1 hypothetical protein [Shewanella profunda]
MSKGELIKKEIIGHPDHYFGAQGKSLDARLDNVKLSAEEESEIQSQHAKKFIRDKALGLFKIGEIVSEIINWNESVDEDLKEAKKEYLLAQYFEKNDQNEKALLQLKEFLSSPQGNTLFNKILRILDDSPPDMELANHLSSALQHVVSNSFYQLFEQHKYALSQIEKLTPQALTILSDHSGWPLIQLGSYSANGTKVSSDWLMEFTDAYCRSKGIRDSGMTTRVRHSINELISTRLIEAHLTGQKGARCVVTAVGESILPYINA